MSGTSPAPGIDGLGLTNSCTIPADDPITIMEYAGQAIGDLATAAIFKKIFDELSTKDVLLTPVLGFIFNIWLRPYMKNNEDGLPKTAGDVARVAAFKAVATGAMRLGIDMLMGKSISLGRMLKIAAMQAVSAPVGDYAQCLAGTDLYVAKS